MAKVIYVSKEGLQKLENELEHLKTVKRQEVAQAIKKARSFGDLSENSEYDEAKNEQGEIESKIAQLEEIVGNAVILDETELKTDKVNVGNKVEIYCIDLDQKLEYEIVGSTEADPINNKISDDSPLGRALIGFRTGDTVTVELPKGSRKYTITAISK